MTAGGKRPGAGRPAKGGIPTAVRLDPEARATLERLAMGGQTQASVIAEALRLLEAKRYKAWLRRSAASFMQG